MDSAVVDQIHFQHLITALRLQNLRHRVAQQVVAIWPRCNGLLVFGEEYSIITVRPASCQASRNVVGSDSGKTGRPEIADLTTKFRKPLITL